MSKNINFYGKVAKFPKNTKAKNAYIYLENIKINKKKLWYFIIEREKVDDGRNDLQLIKYNNKNGVNCSDFISSLKEHYNKNEEIKSYIDQLEVEGSDNFSIIKNIPNVEIGGKKLISIITEDLIRLLY
jgi:hypothetical protein